MYYVNSLKMKTLLRSAFIFQNKAHVHRFSNIQTSVIDTVIQ